MKNVAARGKDMQDDLGLTEIFFFVNWLSNLHISSIFWSCDMYSSPGSVGFSVIMQLIGMGHVIELYMP